MGCEYGVKRVSHSLKACACRKKALCYNTVPNADPKLDSNRSRIRSVLFCYSETAEHDSLPGQPQATKKTCRKILSLL